MYDDDSVEHFSVLLGDFNCTLDKKLDRVPSHQNNDFGTTELKNLLLRYELDDVWRSRFPDTKRYTFQRGNSNDFIFYSKSLNKSEDSKKSDDFKRKSQQHISGRTKQCKDAEYSVDKSESKSTQIDSTTTNNKQEAMQGGSVSKRHNSTVPFAIQTRRKSKLFRHISPFTRKHRFSFMFFLITILFCISYLPRIALMIIESAIANFWDNLTDEEYVISLCFYRGHLLNTVVNPVIYLVFDTDFRSSCKNCVVEINEII
ncbi:unnamed protein product [Mytilus coruscus]|uniref:G-protein coupled receptors family 1 profile domain-containing protein n=1 Tax=Mytilus coruscus TaxID=42192 RepID=A0A6J8C3D5_MYTCO|nr:unnamed protein product [Mytilus coruscus]